MSVLSIHRQRRLVILRYSEGSQDHESFSKIEIPQVAKAPIGMTFRTGRSYFTSHRGLAIQSRRTFSAGLPSGV
jgi:hypothetical protein